MKYGFEDYNWHIQPVRENITRCTLTKGADIKNESWLIQNVALQHSENAEGSEQIIQVKAIDEALIFECRGAEKFRMTGFSLEKIDVIKHSTLGEEPRIEVVKTVDGQRTRIGNLRPYIDRQAFTGEITLDIPKDTGIFGLGQDEEGVYNRRGTKFYLYQHNMRTPIPLMVTDKGYGILFDCPSLMIFDDTDGTTRITLDTVDQIDFYLIAGGLDQVIAGFRCLTGKAVLLPKWAFGYIQSKERYQTQTEVIETAKKYREIGVPIDCIVQDWKTWTGDQWGQKTVDMERFPDLSAMNRELHAMNVHSMVSIWPNMAEDCADHSELQKAGYLLGDYSTYNAFDEKAREMYWRQAEKELYHGGYDSWWCDSTEPFTAPDWCGEVLLPEEKRYELVGGEHKKYLDPALANIFALEHAKGIFENQKKRDANTRVFNLTRSGYAGIQQFGVALWAGDASASWGELNKEIAKGLNMCMSGIPFWTIDIGAFFVGGTACWRKWCGDPNAAPVWFWNGDYDDGVSNPAYRELYTRWLQFGAFLPLFRSHGTDTPREIWNFGKPGEMFYDAIKKAIDLRYQLMPYIYSAAIKVALNDYTMLRSLLFDFSEDKHVKNISNQFMFGDVLMICPVTQPMYYDKAGDALDEQKTRDCYLPEGAGWFDFWTQEYYKGGQTISGAAGIDQIPIFVKAGSIVFSQQPTQYAMEEARHLEVNVFGGADFTAEYFNDDGISYDYLKGEYSCIRFDWNDQDKQLILHKEDQYKKAPIMLKILFEQRENAVRYEGETMVLNLAE